MHDADLIGRGAVKKSGHATIVHDHDAITHAENLRHFGSNNDHSKTLSGEFGDQPVDLRLGADVDAARRLVEDQDARIGEKPTPDQTLLLVASLVLMRSSRLGLILSIPFGFRRQGSLSHDPFLKRSAAPPFPCFPEITKNSRCRVSVRRAIRALRSAENQQRASCR